MGSPWYSGMCFWLLRGTVVDMVRVGPGAVAPRGTVVDMIRVGPGAVVPVVRWSIWFV